MVGSDPYDDLDFDIDDTALGEIANIEAHYTASQAAPQPDHRNYNHPAPQNATASSSKHHTIAQPRNAGPSTNNVRPPQVTGPGGMAPAPFGRTKAGKSRAPAPLNTTPGVTGTGFGWEHGGKRSMDANLPRNLAAIDERQAYWYGKDPVAGGTAVEDAAASSQHVNTTHRQGHSRSTSAQAVTPIEEEDQVLDAHNAAESLQPIAPRLSRASREPSEGARAARAAAIAQAAGPARPAPLIKRSFSRSASTGSHILNGRPQPMAGPSRLSPIPDAPASQTSSQQSSGALLRRTHLELESYKDREKALHQRIAELEARNPAPVAATQRQRGIEDGMELPSATQAAWTANIPVDVDFTDPEAVKKKLRELQAEVYTQKGAVTNIRKQLKDSETKNKQDQERIAAMQVEMTTQMAQRQKDELVRMEAVRTENIFANHSLLTTVSKSRNNHAQSSQRPQRNGMKTPMPNSPSRRGQEDARPLMSSSKGKGKAPVPPPPAQPAFRGLTNAFDPPPVSKKTTRNSNATHSSPIKRASSQRSQGQAQVIKSEPNEPMEQFDGVDDYAPPASPLRTPGGAFAERGAGDVDDGMGDMDAVEAEVEEAEEETEVVKRDERAAFLYTLVNHNRATSLHVHVDRRTVQQSTLRRLLAYQAPSDDASASNVAYPNDRIVWNDTASQLLATLGDGEVSGEKLIARTARHLDSLVEWMLRRLMTTRNITEPDICVIIDLLTLMITLARLFPLFATEVVEHGAHGRQGGSWAMLCLELYTADTIQRRIRDVYTKLEKAQSSPSAVGGERPGAGANGQRGGAGMAGGGIPRRRPISSGASQVRADTVAALEAGSEGKGEGGEEWCTRELGCVVADLGEAMCLYARGDEMDETILDIMVILMDVKQHPMVMRKACQMFQAAATFSSRFRLLTTDRPGRTSLMDQLSDHLANKYRIGDQEESRIVPSLIQMLNHEVNKVWGLNLAGESTVNAALLIYPIVKLLHMFIRPPPFNPSYSSFVQGYNQPLYPSKTITITPDQTRQGPEGTRLRTTLTIPRPADEVKADRLAFLAAQEPLLSPLPDSQLPRLSRIRAGGAGGASQAIALALADGTGIPATLRLKLKLAEWARQPEMRHVRHLFLATLTVLAYDDVSEEMLMPGLEDEGERERMRRRGVRGREIMENLRSAAVLAANILELVFPSPEEVDELWAMYNVDPEDEAEAHADADGSQAVREADRGSDEQESYESGPLMDMEVDLDGEADPDEPGGQAFENGHGSTSNGAPRSNGSNGASRAGRSVTHANGDGTGIKTGNGNGNGPAVSNGRAATTGNVRQGRPSQRQKSQPAPSEYVQVISDDSDGG